MSDNEEGKENDLGRFHAEREERRRRNEANNPNAAANDAPADDQ